MEQFINSNNYELALSFSQKLVDIIFDPEFFREVYFPTNIEIKKVFLEKIVKFILQIVIYIIKANFKTQFLFQTISTILYCLSDRQITPDEIENHEESLELTIKIPKEWGDDFLMIFKLLTD